MSCIAQPASASAALIAWVRPSARSGSPLSMCAGSRPKPMPVQTSSPRLAGRCSDQQRAGPLARHETVGVRARQQAVLALVVAQRRPAQQAVGGGDQHARHGRAVRSACGPAPAPRPRRRGPAARRAECGANVSAEFVLDLREELVVQPVHAPGPLGSATHSSSGMSAHPRAAGPARHSSMASAAILASLVRPRHGCSSATWCAMIHSPPESMKRVSRRVG